MVPPPLTISMVKLLQINLNCCKAAQALMYQKAAEYSADFIIISEPNRQDGPNWYLDLNKKAAIVSTKFAHIANQGLGESGFRWISITGMRIYSCYWSPNTSLADFMDFLLRLERSIRSTTEDILLAGDFNAKHSEWGCPNNDRRGEALADLINTAGLVVCNKGNSCTFNKGTIIDLTFATPRIAQKTKDWMVLDEVTLSDHYYLSYEVDTGTQRQINIKTPKIDIRRLGTALTPETLQLISNCADADRKALALTQAVLTCREPERSGNKTRRSVHWWSPEVSALRRNANHLRRVYQRKKKRLGPDACAREETDAKKAKRELVTAIKSAKEAAWNRFCDQVQSDTWGLPYKLVMGKLTKQPPIPEITTPGRIQYIIDGLFPQHPKRIDESPLEGWHFEEEIAAIDLPELWKAARNLKPKTAPGPDGITTEVVKVILSLLT